MHPLVVGIPIGTWTLAFGLDVLAMLGLVRRKGAEQAAQTALTAGSLGAVAAIATGLAEWQYTAGRDRRVGLVHALVNTTALSLNVASIERRPAEPEIHEHIECKIFYPAMEPVSEDIPAAHSERRQLADLLAATLKLSAASLEFDEHVKALHAALHHHAGSEEESMFHEAQRLGDTRLRELGLQMEAMLDEQRTSRFRGAFREGKISLLEGVQGVSSAGCAR